MIIYLSGTGNSFSVAKQLAAETGDAILPMKKAANDGSKLITFIFPCYANNIPMEMRDLLKTFPFEEGQQAAGLITCGGSTSGNAEYYFNRILSERGVHVDRFYTALMVDNSYSVFYLKPAHECPNNEKTHVSAFLAQDNYVNTTEFSQKHADSEQDFYDILNTGALKKKLVEDRCVGCGICAKMCSSDNIEIIDGKAVFSDKCLQCFGCLHVCPHQAIYMSQPISKINQYFNTNIDLGELNQ